MNIGAASVPIGSVVSDMTVKVTVKGIKWLRLRLAIAKPVFMLGSWLCGFGKVEFKMDGGESE